MAERRYLTKAQTAILRCMAENGGRAIISGGYRWASYSPGRALIFQQALHCMLQNRWVTSKGENERGSYSWTAEGRDAFRNGWYLHLVRSSYWLDPVKPDRAPYEERDEAA